MCHVFTNSGRETTPFREMIRKMPGLYMLHLLQQDEDLGGHFVIIFSDVAEIILNKCTVSDPDIKNLDDERYSVAYNYEFMEDTSNELNRW